MRQIETQHPMPMTDRQKKIYAYIYNQTAKKGYQPSLREIGAHLGVCTNAIFNHLDALRKKGWIDMRNKESRAIRFLYTPSGEKWKGFSVLADTEKKS